MRAVLVTAVTGSALAVTAALAGCGGAALRNTTGVMSAIAFDGYGEQPS